MALRDMRGQTVLVFENVATECAGQVGLVLIVVRYEMLPHVPRVTRYLCTNVAYPPSPTDFVRV